MTSNHFLKHGLKLLRAFKYSLKSRYNGDMNFMEMQADWIENFHDACKSGRLDEVRRIIQKPENLKWGFFQQQGEVGFRRACGAGQLEVVKYLLTSKELMDLGFSCINYKKNHDRGLCAACDGGHLEVVQYLMESRVALKIKIWSYDQHWDHESLKTACQNNHDTVVAYLLEKIKPAFSQREHLNLALNCAHTACYFGKWKVLEALHDSHGIMNMKEFQETLKKHPSLESRWKAKQENRLLTQSIQSLSNDEKTCLKAKPKRL